MRSEKKLEVDADGEAVPKKSASAKAAVESLEAVIKKIEQSFGAGTVMKLDPNSTPTRPVDVVSTGSLGLDIALGVGGLPKGRIIEIFGPESSGKTTLALQVVAQAQARGDHCCFIDAEHALGTELSL
jgi:recombination protein RecA